jgi:signal peptidase I
MAATTQVPDLTTPQASYFNMVRETVESLAVAFVLALLFKAFIAEAFVIPTGSMAPTLMGAHKDIKCEECGNQFQCGASDEFTETGAPKQRAVVGVTCPLCRKPQIADPNRDSNHATFSGDRILVSKLAYVFSKPRRWDVIVFKYLLDARLNYIKRCIGLPSETIRIRDGDIYIQKRLQEKQAEKNQPATLNGPFEIARKPPFVVLAMAQKLYDSKHLAKSLIAAGVPNAWQPFPLEKDANPAGSWKIDQDGPEWNAMISNVSAGSTHWMRYYHRVVDPIAWAKIESTKQLAAPMAAQSSRLITDFTAYNAAYYVDRPDSIAEPYRDFVTRTMRDITRRSFSISQSVPTENDGVHWTGDLAVEADFVTTAGTQSIAFLLVEAGVEHECRIDLKSGLATATVMLDGVVVDAFGTNNKATLKNANSQTSIRSGGRHRVRFANVDNTLNLWVDGKHVPWEVTGNMFPEGYQLSSARLPKTSPTNPLDAAPVAIGVEGGGAEVFRCQVFRDIYHIACSNGNNGLYDYRELPRSLRESSTAEGSVRYARDVHNTTLEVLLREMSKEAICRNLILSDANQWSNSCMATARQTVDFRMEDDWFFPMGDNSSASSDGRIWGHTPERLMIGRAVMVFWPHYWNAPIPFVPNVQRMGLIR